MRNKEEEETPMESILILSPEDDDSRLDPIDRGGTSSTNYTVTEQNVRRSLLINDDHVKRSPSSSSRQHQKNKRSFAYHRLFHKFKTSVQQRMAFQPSVPNDPRLFSKNKKRLILACLAAGSSLNGFCSTVYFPGIPDIRVDLNATEIGITLVSSLFILFGGIGPLFWASMSDYYHIRRFLYLVSLLIFIGASVGCALSSSIWMLVVFRCIQSVGTSVTMSVGAGTVADCWQITERGSAFSFLFVGQFLGPLVGPIVGGGVTTAIGWRSVFWICAGYGVLLFLFLFFFFPETYRLDHQWDQTFTELQSQTTLVDLSSVVVLDQEEPKPSTPPPPPPPVENTTRFNPFKSFMMLKYAFVCCVAIEIGFCFGTMFTLETLIPDLYYEHYGFDSWQTGLSFIGAGIGNVLGSIVSGRLSDYLLIRSSNQRGGLSKAEDRLTLNAWPGGFILIPLGVLLFGWSIMAGFTVWPAIIGFSILCFGMSQVYTAGSAYLVDSIPGKGASVTAACNFFRMTMAAILSMVSPIMGSALSIGYVSVLLASLNIIGMALLVLIKFKGVHMRRKAGFTKY
ncbi:major facilitator superfamily domain-containing protein [Mucor mucedo]|uniref:major facilitator superfamily domain-containing protein n=1 Tax=Mucor mucedo TaxID=29922 RepID=UPI00221FF952|nr:major facilitator superfamily domain-containing protein [Mucor mucedo]KAI7896717.1 major facilitator superfamily domain-containing protein [Mucor mucedo]